MTAAPKALIGRSPDSLTIEERAALTGRWIAIELYSPETLPLRLIAAVGSSAADCAAQLQAQAMDPTRFEYTMIRPAY